MSLFPPVETTLHRAPARLAATGGAAQAFGPCARLIASVCVTDAGRSLQTLTQIHVVAP